MTKGFLTAIHHATTKFYEEMERQGWVPSSCDFGTTRLADNTKRGRKHRSGIGTVYGSTVELKEIFTRNNNEPGG